jgi:hypothetical protein
MRVPPTSRRIPLQRLHIERIAFALSNDWRALNHVHREVQVDVVGVEFWVLLIGEVFCLLTVTFGTGWRFQPESRLQSGTAI